jgi:hypothetical protein
LIPRRSSHGEIGVRVHFVPSLVRRPVTRPQPNNYRYDKLGIQRQLE